MKELSIEEKAKAYDEAIERAKEMIKDMTNIGGVAKVDDIQYLFPELKESEDEKIRKELLEHCVNRRDGKQVCVDASDYRRWADWLFKQGVENIPNVKSDKEINNEIIQFLQLPYPQFVGKRHQEEWIAWLEKQSVPTEDELEALRIAAYEPTKNWSEKLQSLYEKLIHYEQGEQKSEEVDNLHNYLYGEQKPVDNIEPKFKVGDIIKPKDPVLGEPRIIKGIHSKFGYDTNNGILDFEFEDNWELVEQKFAYTKEYDFHGIKFIPKFAKGDIIKDKKRDEVSTIEDFSYDTGLYTHTYGQFPITIQDNYEIIGQNPADKIEPKFKVGDKIKLAKEPKYPAREIIAIQNDAYYFDKLVHLPFSHQDEWELVEQKPANKVEPKFRVGDWIVSDEHPNCGNSLMKIVEVGLTDYLCGYYNGQTTYCHKFIDKSYHLWTIEDAKDGDVLSSNQLIILFKQWEDNTDYSFVIAHAGIDVSGELQITMEHWLISNKSKPATKEQRDLLFQKIHEAGYEWDAKNKKLKEEEIDNNYIYGEQESALNEEDERTYKSIIYSFDHNYPLTIQQQEFVKSFLKPQNTWKPSDEQMERLKGTINSLPHQEVLYSLYQNLKKLRGE